MKNYKYKMLRSELMDLQKLCESAIADNMPVSFSPGKEPKRLFLINNLVKCEMLKLRNRTRAAIERQTKVEVTFTIPFSEAMAFFAVYPFWNPLSAGSDLLIYKICIQIDKNLI